jgi:hypothetical protein
MPPESLAHLARQGPAEVRRRVAGNPNAPIEALWSLAEDFPDEVLGNAVLEFALLESPSLYDAVPLPARRSLAGSLALGGPMARVFRETRDRIVLERLAANPATPPDLLISLSAHENQELRALAARNPATPSGWVGLLLHAGSTPTLDGFHERPGRLSSAETAQLHEAGYWGRMLLAHHPQTPPAQLEQLALHSPWAGVRREAAWSPRASPELLATLMRPGAELTVLLAAAVNPATPAECLRRLVVDDEPQVRARADVNPSLEPACRRLFARARGEEAGGSTIGREEQALLRGGGAAARSILALHPATPPETLVELAGDPSSWVRQSLCRRPALPEAALRRLRQDEDPEVQAALRGRATR